MAEDSQRIRLHISPFNPTLLPAIIPASVQSSATGLSYHTVPTFPENNYGYIELPASAALQIKKKLNGYFLKGMKMKIEEARPDKKRKSQQAELAEGRADIGDAAPKRPRKEKRVKEQGVFPGVQLPEGREVKRGWTQPKESEKKGRKHGEGRKEKKSKDHEGQELLFKTHLPANVSSKTSDKEKKKHKSTRKPGRDAEVKEFTQSTKYPAFLRDPKGSGGAAQAVEFVDGKGWVDGEGNVVEPVVQTRSTRRRQVVSPTEEAPVQSEDVQEEATQALPEEERSSAEEDSAVSEADDVQLEPPQPATAAPAANVSVDAKASSAEPEDNQSDEEDEEAEVEDVTMTAPDEASDADPSSSSADSDSSEAEDDEAGAEAEEAVKPSAPLAASPSEDTAPAPITNPTAPIALTTTEPSSSLPLPDVPNVPKAIHPLEALYKRSTAPSTSTTKPVDRTPSKPSPIQTTFSFFNSGNGDEEDAQDGDDGVDALGARELMPPRTPFTQRDFESRGMRSAAPTPDTAAIGKRFAWNVEGGDDEEEDEEEEVDDDEEDDDEESANEDEGRNVGGEGGAVQADTAVSILGTGAPDDALAEQTEFEKHFWAMRGEYNRSWKARKREAKKEQRQSENRRTGFGR